MQHLQYVHGALLHAFALFTIFLAFLPPSCHPPAASAPVPGGFAQRAQQDWQLLHGALPPALLAHLNDFEFNWALRLAAWLLWIRRSAPQGPWQIYCALLPQVHIYVCVDACTRWDACVGLFCSSITACERKQHRSHDDEY